MADQPLEAPILLSALPASASQRRIAVIASLCLLTAFLATLPVARIGWFRFPAFILINQSLLMANDLITAAVLIGHAWLGRSRSLSVLAGGYLFTGLIVIPHALTFPGAFSEAGLLVAGPQSAAWLYIAWHAVLPLTVMIFALRRGAVREEQRTSRKVGAAILSALLAAVGGVVALTLLTVVGHDWLPELIDNGHFTLAARIAVGALLMLPLGALLLLAIRQPRLMLDLWLMVVMFAWLCTIGLGAFVSNGRFDIGWYAGRTFDWLTSLFILLVLFFEIIALYERSFHASAIERRERERHLKETEAVLVHLSRVSELGQNVSSLIHEVNQPLTAISNYLQAGILLADAPGSERIKSILERSAEQASRAAGIVNHLREFITRRETEKRIEDVPALLQDAVRLALTGISTHAPEIELQCAPSASSAFFNRIQIEQVAFNLVRNAIEAMENSERRALTITTSLNSASMVEVSVSDTGHGLSPEIRARLFEPFVTSKPSGLGIGLSICRVIVEAHGGQLQAGDNPGGGTVFRFTLPQTSALGSEEQAAAPS